MTMTANLDTNLRRTRFFFLHHGETDWDRDGRVAGRINAPLNGRGLAQARRAGEILLDAGIRTICTSPQDRALVTADIVAAHIHAPVVVVDGLKDCCFGPLDGATGGDWFTAWRHGVTPEGAESAERFQKRGIAAMNAALERPGPVLVVAHPAIYQAFMGAAGIAAETDALPLRAATVPILHEPPRRRDGFWHAAHLAA